MPGKLASKGKGVIPVWSLTVVSKGGRVLYMWDNCSRADEPGVVEEAPPLLDDDVSHMLILGLSPLTASALMRPIS